MKKIILFSVTLIFFVAQIYAQINLGIKGGLNLATAKYAGSKDNKVRTGFNAGLFTQITISKEFRVRPELLYSIKGFRFPATPFSGKGTLSLNYISIPLLIAYLPGSKFSILSGPEFGFLTKANSKFDGSSHDVSSYYRKFDVAIDLGIACLISNGFGAEVRGSYGFNDLADATQTDSQGNQIANYRVGGNRVLQFGIFYSFPL